MIRPFQPGDIFLIQRLHRQTTKLNAVQSLLSPRSPSWAALTAVNLWDDAKVVTFVLRQNGHGLARAGFLQAQKRAKRAEADILLLAPALDTPTGHPAVWEKLLSHYLHEAMHHAILRVYADVPDQPLLVNTFAHVGFNVYQRQTIWRLVAFDAGSVTEDVLHDPSVTVRPQEAVDEWALLRLYERVTPRSVQMAEGGLGESPVRPPFLERWGVGDTRSFVLLVDGEIAGYIQVVSGQMGVWLQLCVDANQPDGSIVKHLLLHGLALTGKGGRRLPVYIAVTEQQGGLAALLADLGFAPFTDQAQMVKPMVQWVIDMEPVRTPAMEITPEAVVTIQSAKPHVRLFGSHVVERGRRPQEQITQVERIGEYVGSHAHHDAILHIESAMVALR